MKRIFLTSGLVLCMACPALATDISNNGVNQCVYNVLGTAENNADVQLRAKWADNYTAMTLNENDGNATANGGLTGSDQRPTDLFLVGRIVDNTQIWDGVYKRTGSDTVADPYVFTQLSEGDAVLGDTPVIPSGISVNFTFNLNASTVEHQDSEVTNVPTSTAQTRQFLGYYANGTTAANAMANPSTNQYITSAGALTSAGETAAIGYDNNTPWQAVYSLVHPTGANLTTGSDTNRPALTGYTFQGWSTASDGSPMSDADYNALNIGENTTLYAIWGTNSTKVIYNCGSGVNGSTGSFINNSTLANATYDSTEHAREAEYDKSYEHPSVADNCEMRGYRPGNWVCVSGTTSATTGGLAGNGIANSKWNVDTSVVTCTATWEQNTINLHWDSNNATEFDATTVDVACTYDESISLPTAPERTGYTFGGWEVVSSPSTLVDSPTVPTPGEG